MELIKIVAIIVGGLITAIGLFVGLYQYNRQQKFKRLQNLSFIWQKFINNDDLMELFTLLDSDNNETINNFPAITKLKFLALLEEAALYAEEFEVDKDQAIYLFQWHFYYLFNDIETKASFWNNLGGSDETEKPYWSKSKKFSKSCNPINKPFL